MPGCLGDDPRGNDYCVFPENLEEEAINEESLTPSSPWHNGFQLKLYWEEGYMWQNETVERKCRYKMLLLCLARFADYWETGNTHGNWLLRVAAAPPHTAQTRVYHAGL